MKLFIFTLVLFQTLLYKRVWDYLSMKSLFFFKYLKKISFTITPVAIPNPVFYENYIQSPGLFVGDLTPKLSICAKQRVAPYTEETEVTRRDWKGDIDEARKVGMQKGYGPKTLHRLEHNVRNTEVEHTFDVYTTKEIDRKYKDLMIAVVDKFTITAPKRNHEESLNSNQLPKELTNASLWDFIDPIQRNWECVCKLIQKNEKDLEANRNEAKKANESLDKKFSNTILDMASAIRVEITPSIQENIKNDPAFREAITNAAMQKLLETILKLEERVKQLESEYSLTTNPS